MKTTDIENTDIVVEKPWGQMTFSNDPYIGDPSYEKGYFDLVSERCSGEDELVCYDLGAHQGLWTCFLATFRPNTVVHSFEPNPFVFSYLTRNIKLLGLVNVMCYQVALSNTEGKATLWIDDSRDTTGSSLVKRAHSKSIEVEVVRLDSFKDLPKPGFIKIDVEYKDFEVLVGMGDMLFKSPLKLLVEIHGHVEKKVIPYLQGFGFECEQMSNYLWCTK